MYKIKQGTATVSEFVKIVCLSFQLKEGGRGGETEEDALPRVALNYQLLPHRQCVDSGVVTGAAAEARCPAGPYGSGKRCLVTDARDGTTYGLGATTCPRSHSGDSTRQLGMGSPLTSGEE